MPGEYAKNTTVPVYRSKGEIEKTLRRYDADSCVIGESISKGMGYVAFEQNGVSFRIDIDLPVHDARRQTKRQWEQSIRQRWRALLLFVKANLEVTSAGIMTAQQAFMPYVLVAGEDGRPVPLRDRLALKLSELQAGGKLPDLLE